MTSFGTLFKVMSRDRFRLVNKIILAELAVIAVTLLWSLMTSGVEGGEIFGVTGAWSFPTFWIVFIMLSVANERVFTRDTYRLIPIGETKLYTVNLLSAFAMILYFAVVQVIFYLVTMMAEKDYLLRLFSDISGGPDTATAVKATLGMFILGLSIIIMGLTTISLVHLTVSATNNFLPNISRRAVDIVLYIIVIYLLVRIAIFVFNEINNFGSLLSTGMQTQFILNICGVLVIALVEAIINVFLLKKWVETIPN
ncbi:ABC transporter permease [Levilactobacillus enshiensis]|uniref:ABC transporter permease n=1 Tax=Levilactobacillus enshiensis TaxID=2590213 RepID=UPI00117B3EE0|nr:ABC transporter permease [Levilactobacillus enshiensis]